MFTLIFVIFKACIAIELGIIITTAPSVFSSDSNAVKFENVNKDCGDQVILTCAVIATKKQLYWYRSSFEKIQKIFYESSIDQLSPYKVESTDLNQNLDTDLVLLAFLTRFDTGWYTCLNLSTEGYPKVTRSIWLEVRCGGNENNYHTKQQIEKIQNGIAPPYVCTRRIFNSVQETLYIESYARGYPKPKYNITYVKNHRETSLEGFNVNDAVINLRIPLTELKVPTTLSFSVCNTNGCINDTIQSIHVTGNRIVIEETPSQTIHLGCNDDDPYSDWNSTWLVNTTRNTTITSVELESEFYNIPEITYLDEGFYECRKMQNSNWIPIAFFQLKIWNDSTPAILSAEQGSSFTNHTTTNVIQDYVIKRSSTTTAAPTTTKVATNFTTINNPSTTTTSSTTRSTPTNSSSTTSNATYYSKYFRVYVKLMEAYTYDFDDHSSFKFEEYERKITTGFKEIFSSPDFARARLVAILSTFDISQSRAVVDLEFSDLGSEARVGDTLYGQLTSYKKIGSLAASPENPYIINFGRKFPFQCSTMEIPCKNSSKCIPSSGRCDKNATCLDGSDEEECPGPDRCTANDKFSCPNSGGILVCASVKCDGKKDCPGGEDEPPTCDKTPGQESSQPAFGKYGMIIKILVIIVLVILLITVICGILFFCKYKREIRQKDTQIAKMTQLVKKIVVKKQINIDEDFPDVLNMPVVSIERLKSGKVKNGMVSVGEYEMPLDDSWEYPRQNLHLGDTLGEGEFGKVVQAEATNIWERGNGMVTVAVKMLKDDHMDSDMVDLVSEMELMKLLGSHQNILRLLGCCSQGGPLLVITEYARNGNLKNFLRKHLHHSTEIEESTLLTYARQIAQGMVYLSSIKCIHRDLAARNILVTAQYTMKIADFGLARDVRHTEYYKKTSKGRLPIKWMAPEALFHNRYTLQSDVWSFGILLWEIITLGDDPYPSIEDLAGLRNALKQNYRMEKPPNASTNVYNLMMDCWSFEPEDRPNFLSIVERLKELVTDARPKVVDGSYHSENSDESESQSVISTTESSEDKNEIRKPILE